LAGYRSASKQVRVEVGKPNRVELALERIKFQIDVASTPAGASVTVDGETFKTPRTFSVFAAKAYRFKFEAKNHEPKSMLLDVKESAPGNVHADLVPFRFGTLSMNAFCAETAKIGGKIFKLPMRAEKFRVGTYEAKLHCEELSLDKTESFTIADGLETKKYVEFKR
jgi:hypothetical protein